MDTVHSFNIKDFCADDIYEQVLCLSQDFTNMFEAFVNRAEAIGALPQKIFAQTKNATHIVLTVLSKLKQAYIYSNYTPNKNYISAINAGIKKLKLLKVSLTHYPRKKLINSNSALTYSLRNSFYKLQSLCIEVKNTAEKLIDTSKRHFSYTKDAWPKSDVLVGSLRNSKQLITAIKHDFYHIPKTLVENPLGIKCIAIYQSHNLFDKDCGIKYYGKVLSFSEVARHEIKEIPRESDEIYIRFEIDKWRTLKSPIKADYLGDTCLLTTLFQFMNCEKSSQLLLTSKEEFDLYMFMKDSAFTPNVAFFSFESQIVLYNGELFEVVQDGKSVLKITSDRFVKNNISAIKTIASLIKPKLD